jgi:hypothetical protein
MIASRSRIYVFQTDSQASLLPKIAKSILGPSLYQPRVVRVFKTYILVLTAI